MGCRRTVQEWQHIWNSWATKTKNKARKVKTHMAATGGGPAMPGLSDIEEKILYIVGTASVDGFANEEVGVPQPAAAAQRRDPSHSTSTSSQSLFPPTRPALPPTQPALSPTQPPLPPAQPPLPLAQPPLPLSQPPQSQSVHQRQPRSRTSTRGRARARRPRPPVHDNLVRSLNDNNRLLTEKIIEASNIFAAAMASLGSANIRAAEILADAIRSNAVVSQQDPSSEEPVGPAEEL